MKVRREREGKGGEGRRSVKTERWERKREGK